MKEIFKQYHQWLESVLSNELPGDIAGFAVNLYDNDDSYDAELIGAPTFDENDEDWACNDIYMSQRFNFPLSHFSGGWEKNLALIVESTKQYMESNSTGAVKLKSAKGVGVGFVDGQLQLVSKNA